MRIGLIARARHIQIGDPFIPKHPETVHALGAEVDPRVRRRGGDEEERLARNEGAVIIGQGVEEFGHFPLPPPA